MNTLNHNFAILFAGGSFYNGDYEIGTVFKCVYTDKSGVDWDIDVC